MYCKHCQSENIQRLEVIYLKESKSFNSIGTNINSSGGIGITGSIGNISSLLVKKISPPEPKKEYRNNYKLMLIFGFLFLLLGFIMFECFVSDYNFAITVFFFFEGIGVIFFIFSKKDYCTYKETINYNQTIYPELYKEWQNKWYCNKCGEIFELKQDNI